jgi:hypothetical protein
MKHKVKHIHFVGQAAWSRCVLSLAAKPEPTGMHH